MKKLFLLLITAIACSVSATAQAGRVPTLLLSGLLPMTNIMSAAVMPDPPTPEIPNGNDDVEEMKMELMMVLYGCMDDVAGLHAILEKKATEDEAPELYDRLYEIEHHLDNASYELRWASTVEELENLRDFLEYIKDKIYELEEDIERLDFVITGTTIEGVAMTFYILSEEDKTVQVGTGEEASIRWNTTGTVTIPAIVNGYAVTAIADNAFLGCEYISGVVIPESVTTIGCYAFHACKSLTSLHIPASATSLDSRFLGSCRDLTSLTVAEGNPVYDSRQDCNAIIESDSVLFAACNLSVIPEGVKTVGAYAFDFCSAEYVDFPDGVWLFLSEAFSGSNIRFYIIGNVEKIGYGFYAYNFSHVEAEYMRNDDGTLTMTSNGAMWRYDEYGPDFTEYAIPETVIAGEKVYTVSTLGNYSFYGCKALKELTIPATITAFKGIRTFHGCTALTSIISCITEPFDFNEACIESDTYTRATLYVPYGTKHKYEARKGWQNFTNIVEEDIDGIKDMRNEGDDKHGSTIVNLAGQRLNMMQKGINIIDGKKVLVK